LKKIYETGFWGLGFKLLPIHCILHGRESFHHAYILSTHHKIQEHHLDLYENNQLISLSSRQSLSSCRSRTKLITCNKSNPSPMSTLYHIGEDHTKPPLACSAIKVVSNQLIHHLHLRPKPITLEAGWIRFNI
jgi:hypothetical protein